MADEQLGRLGNDQDARRATGTRRLMDWCLPVLSVGVAAWVLVELRGKAEPTPNGIFFCAIILSAWFGGPGPGILATILATVLAALMSRYYSETTSGISALELPSRFLFLGTGIFISWLTGRQQRAKSALRAMSQNLERTVEERTAELRTANENLLAGMLERKRAESLVTGEKRVLEKVAKDDPLGDILDTLCRLIEEQAGDALVSILLLEGDQLRHGGAPSLPKPFVEGVDGGLIGPSAGSCGTAAFRKEAVFVEDIATDPLWQDYRAVALPAGLRACWSTPIFNAQGCVLGTFAMYYRQPGKPQPEHLHLIEVATHIAAIAISGDRDRVALRDSEAKLKEAQQLARIGYWERDLVADRITWSEETCRIFGVTSSDPALNQAKILEMIYPDDRAIQTKAFEAALRGCHSYDVEYRIVRPDGQIRFVHAWDKIECDQTGRPIHMFGTIQDITERRQTEDALRRSEDELRLVIDTIPVMAWTLRPDGVVDFLNRRWIDYAGLSLQEYVADPTSLLHPEDIAGVIEKWRIQMAAGEAYDDEMRLRRADGEFRWFLVRTAPLRDEQHHIVKWYGVSTDIEDRKRAEAAAQASQQLLELVLATLPLGVAVTDKAGNFVLNNEAAKRIWGETIVSGGERWARSEGYWHGTGEKIAPADWASARALADGQTSLDELIDIRTYDRQLKTIQNSSAPIRNAEGVIIGSVIVNEDVTERIQTEDALRQTQAELTRMARVMTMGELTASIAHEVNQPLTAIVNNASACLNLLDGLAGDITEVRAALAEIAQDGERAGKVIDRVRALVRKDPPKLAPCDLRVITKDVLGLASHESVARGVAVSTQMPETLPLVRGDQVQLQQILLNLVMNGMEAMAQTEKNQRTLVVSGRADALDGRAGVTVEVRDHGIGLKPGESDKVFDAFYSTKPDGLGMGLAISRSLVESHGGRLWARPNDGPGTTFAFWLPALEPAGE